MSVEKKGIVQQLREISPTAASFWVFAILLVSWFTYEMIHTWHP